MTEVKCSATGTCQLLVDGRYNDILVAGEHYIPLRADLGNAPEALARFCDPAERGRIAAAAHDLVHASHTYRHRLSVLHDRLSVGTDNLDCSRKLLEGIHADSSVLS